MEFTNLLLTWFTNKRDCLLVDIPKDVMFIIQSYCVGPFIGQNNNFIAGECNGAHKNAGFEDYKCAKCDKKADYFAAERYYCKNCVDGYKRYCEESGDTVMYEECIYDKRIYDYRLLGNYKDEVRIRKGLHQFINCKLCPNDYCTMATGQPLGGCRLCCWASDVIIKVYHWTPTQIIECDVCTDCSESKNDYLELNKVISIITDELVHY